MAGQSIGDRLVAAQHTILGSETGKIVCKASTTEATPPKKKHLDYLLLMTNEPNVNIPELANFLVDRTRQFKWVVVFKALITTHHLMCNGNERFLQHLASRNGLFSLESFLDKTGTQSYEMSSYLRRYSVYLNQKAISYRTVAYDFTRVKRGKDGFVRTLESDELLRALPVLQQQLDCLLDFDASSRSLNNGIIISAFMLLFKDLIRLFACYNDGIINLLEKFFSMKKNQCKEAVDIYKKFIIRMNKVSDMLKVAEQVGVDKGDIPELTHAPKSLLESLEQHVASLDNKKMEHKHFSSAANLQISTLKNINNSLTKVEQNTPDSLFAEEKNAFESFATNLDSFQQVPPPQQQQPSPTSTTTTENFLDIFGGVPATSPATSVSSNPFSENFAQVSDPFQSSSSPPLFGIGMQQSPQQQLQSMFPANSAQQPQVDLFGFTQSTSTLGDTTLSDASAKEDFFASSDLLQPLKTNQNISEQPMQKSSSQASGIGISLESSLVDLQLNLKKETQKANQDFQPKEKRLTGGNAFDPNSLASLSTINANSFQPVGVSMNPQQPAMFGVAPMGVRPVMPLHQPQQAPAAMPFNQPFPQASQSRPMNPSNPFL